VKIRNGIIILFITLILSLFLFGGFCLESPSAMLVGIAEGQASRGEYDEAIRTFNTALEKSPNSWYVHLHRGEFYLRIERYEEAAADLTRVLEIYPKIHDAYRIYAERGDCYRKLSRYDEAITDYGKSLAARPNHAPALFGRGLAYREAGRNTEALADLGRACGLKYEPACEAYRTAR
jgi:tetratricopeptide (TPR) repeat protein